tara:strand:+ start:2593 stop:3132 length:540 start_codon:yes stop_codon:yes gene_type:complete
MSREDDIAAAELAAAVGGHLRGVDSKMIHRSSTDPGNQLHPSQFLTNNYAPKRNTTSESNLIPSDVMIEAPKSRSAGSEIVGTEEVNLEHLMIPMDGADDKMREAMAAYTNASSSAAPPPVRQQPVVQPVVQPVAQPVAVQDVPPSEDLVLLREINNKLDLIIKRTKIQPKYKKAKAKA